MKKILMVCLGNICRSPLAEGILKHKLREMDLQAIVDSAGIADYHVGEKPDKRTIKNALSHGIDLSDLRARQFKPEDFNRFDLIYAADASIFHALMMMAPDHEAKKKVKMMTEELFPNQKIDVPDPYYGGEEGFESVYQLINKSCDAIIEKHFKTQQS
jgi:protein-tyrosine phosphatase